MNLMSLGVIIEEMYGAAQNNVHTASTMNATRIQSFARFVMTLLRPVNDCLHRVPIGTNPLD